MSVTLNSVQLPLNFAPLRQNEPPAPQPPPQEPPAPPQDPEPQIDFNKIDCPFKAVLLPTINPAILASTFAGLVTASMTGAPAAAALALVFDSTPGSLQYSFDPNSPESMIKASGTLGEAAYTENWAVNQETGAITITGNVGESAQELTLTQDEEQNCMFLTGTIGDVAVNQRIFSVASESGDEARNRLVIDGTVGGRAYHQEISLGEEDGVLINNGYIHTSDLSGTVMNSGTDEGQSTMAAGDMAGVAFGLEATLTQAQP